MKTLKIVSAFVVMFVCMSCTVNDISLYKEAIDGNGNLIKQERNVSDFDKLEMSGAFDVIVKQGDKERLVIEADENIMSYIETKVENGTLSVDMKNEFHYNHSKTPKIYLFVKSLISVESSGENKIYSSGTITANDFKIDVSGVGKIDMTIETGNLHVESSGVSDIELKGKAESVKIEISGAGDVKALEFVVNNCNIEISGTGNASVNVSDKLDVSISGIGKVSYKGSPTVNSESGLMGQLKHIEN